MAPIPCLASHGSMKARPARFRKKVTSKGCIVSPRSRTIALKPANNSDATIIATAAMSGAGRERKRVCILDRRGIRRAAFINRRFGRNGTLNKTGGIRSVEISRSRTSLSRRSMMRSHEFRRETMKYILLIYGNEAAMQAASKEETDRMHAAYMAYA